jgi:hypothetical protein
LAAVIFRGGRGSQLHRVNDPLDNVAAGWRSPSGVAEDRNRVGVYDPTVQDYVAVIPGLAEDCNEPYYALTHDRKGC